MLKIWFINKLKSFIRKVVRKQTFPTESHDMVHFVKIHSGSIRARQRLSSLKIQSQVIGQWKLGTLNLIETIGWYSKYNLVQRCNVILINRTKLLCDVSGQRDFMAVLFIDLQEFVYLRWQYLHAYQYKW